jgi:diadenylate cyclase
LNVGVQIAVLWVAYYYIFLFFRGTRGAQVLVGLAVLFFVLIILTQSFSLDVLSWILQRFSVVLGVALLVIFQPEIRRALAELGRQPVFSMSADKRTVIEAVVQAVAYLADQKIGGLIAIEREIGTRSVQETGVPLDTSLVPELLASIFFPHTPLHDGGVIISGDRIVAAGCVFPLSQDTELLKTLGTRHRAAVGLTEETDAVVVVVSEETGTISVSYRGRLSRGLDGDRVRRFLSTLLRERKAGNAWRRAQKKLDLTPAGIAKAEGLTGQEKTSGQ